MYKAVEVSSLCLTIGRHYTNVEGKVEIRVALGYDYLADTVAFDPA